MVGTLFLEIRYTCTEAILIYLFTCSFLEDDNRSVYVDSLCIHYSLLTTPVFHKHVSISQSRRKRFRKPGHITGEGAADPMKSHNATRYTFL